MNGALHSIQHGEVYSAEEVRNMDPAQLTQLGCDPRLSSQYWYSRLSEMSLRVSKGLVEIGLSAPDYANYKAEILYFHEPLWKAFHKVPIDVQGILDNLDGMSKPVEALSAYLAGENAITRNKERAKEDEFDNQLSVAIFAVRSPQDDLRHHRRQSG